jgi:hypothetical protein
MLISGGVTATKGLATNSFSWADIGISTFFGGVGGAIGLKVSGLREVLIGIGLGSAEEGAGVILIKRTNCALKLITRQIFNLFNMSHRYL